MTTHRTKLWLGLGSFLLAGTSTAALAFGSGGPGGPGANVTVLDAVRGAAAVEIAAGNEGGEKGRHRSGNEGGEKGRHRSGGEGGEAGERSRPKAGGEGGEGGEGGAAPGAVNVRFLALLGQMEGHLDAAKRLFDQGQFEMAQPHFHHPYLEVYEIIEKDLTARGIPPFEATLKNLGQAGDARDADKIANGYAAAKTAIGKARATVHPDVLASPKVQVQVAIALLKSAAHEYEQAVKDGNIDVIEEYQDGWGFVQAAERAIAGVSAQLRKTAPEIDDRVNEHLKALKRAWPDVVLPKRAILGTGEVHALVSRIELAASRIGQ